MIIPISHCILMISLLLAISLESFNKKPSTAASLLKVQQLTAFSLEGGLHEKIHQVLGRDSIEKPKKKRWWVMAVLQTLGVWGRSPRSGSIMFMFAHFDKTWCNSSWVPSCKWVKANSDLSTGPWLGPSVHVVWLHPKVTLQDAVDQHLYQKCVIDGNLIDSLLKR